MTDVELEQKLIRQKKILDDTKRVVARCEKILKGIEIQRKPYEAQIELLKEIIISIAKSEVSLTAEGIASAIKSRHRGRI